MVALLLEWSRGRRPWCGAYPARRMPGPAWPAATHAQITAASKFKIRSFPRSRRPSHLRPPTQPMTHPYDKMQMGSA